MFSISHFLFLQIRKSRDYTRKDITEIEKIDNIVNSFTKKMGEFALFNKPLEVSCFFQTTTEFHTFPNHKGVS